MSCRSWAIVSDGSCPIVMREIICIRWPTASCCLEDCAASAWFCKCRNWTWRSSATSRDSVIGLAPLLVLPLETALPSEDLLRLLEDDAFRWMFVKRSGRPRRKLGLLNRSTIPTPGTTRPLVFVLLWKPYMLSCLTNEA